MDLDRFLEEDALFSPTEKVLIADVILSEGNPEEQEKAKLELSKSLDRRDKDFEYCQYLGVRPLTIKRAYQQAHELADELELPSQILEEKAKPLRASDLSLLVTEAKALRKELDGTISIVEDDSGLSWQEKLLRIKQELAEGDTAKELGDELQDAVKDRGATLEFAEALGADPKRLEAAREDAASVQLAGPNRPDLVIDIADRALERGETDVAQDMKGVYLFHCQNKGLEPEFPSADVEALDLSDVWKDIFKRKELKNRAKEAVDALALDTEPALDASLSR